MSYYVNTTDCDFTVKRENYGEAYRLLCELNARLLSRLPRPPGGLEERRTESQRLVLVDAVELR